MIKNSMVNFIFGLLLNFCFHEEAGKICSNLVFIFLGKIEADQNFLRKLKTGVGLQKEENCMWATHPWFLLWSLINHDYDVIVTLFIGVLINNQRRANHGLTTGRPVVASQWKFFKILQASSAIIWQNPLSPLLHFSRKSRFSFQVFLRMFLIVDFY